MTAAATAGYQTRPVTHQPVIRKQHGHYLEDFRPGQLLRHKGGKTVTEGIFALFTDFA